MLLLKTLSDPQLIDALQAGAVGILPTDTTYGLVCRAADKQAVAKLYETKRREAKPGTVIAASIDQLIELGIPRRYLTAVEHLWPNPLSIIIPTAPGMEYIDRGLMSLAVRIPADPAVVALLERTGALLTTSANMPGQPVATSVVAAREYFGDTLDFYVDAGIQDKPASTIIRVIDDEIEVVRQGLVAFNDEGKIV